MVAGKGDDGWRLVETLETECRLLAELVSIFEQQWMALSADNGEAVDDSMFAGHRILDTLRAAQRRQQVLVERLTGDRSASLALMDEVLCEEQAQLVAQLRGRISEHASALASEIRRNGLMLAGSTDPVAADRTPAICGMAFGRATA